MTTKTTEKTESEIYFDTGFAEEQTPFRLKKGKMSKPFEAALDAVEKMGQKDKN